MFSETPQNLAKIKIRECHEKTADLRRFKSKIVLSSYVKERKDRSLLRKTMVKMLLEAQEYLPKGYKLRLECGYRSREDEKTLYEVMEKKLRKKHQSWSEKKFKSYLHKLIFPLNVRISSPHATGGAVDVSIISPRGKLLQRSPWLGRVMRRAGLSNYQEESWHWSYGDSGWALRAGKKYAIYGEV